MDALGHTRALLDNQGNLTDTYVYDAWGNLNAFTGTTPNPFTWNGAYGYQWIEFTGLYHIGAREYDPRVGRWLQRDPIGVAGGHPNVYLYCLNDPLSFADPTGTDLWEKFSNWYWGGMGGISQLVDNMLLGGATENFGRTVGEYDCGNASGWEVVGSGVWLGFQLLPVARPVKAVSSGSKALINQAVKTQGAVRNPGGRLGNPATRQQVGEIADELERRSWTVTRGGNRPGLKEEYISGSPGTTKGSSYADITAEKNGRTLRINTVDTCKNGKPTAREARNAARIRQQKPNDHLLLIPKRKRK